jgi:Ca-activated chloride channel family protein
MNFAEPLWLIAGLAAIGVLVWTWMRYDVRQRAALASFASSHLHEQLTASFSTLRRNWQRGLFAGSIALLFVALARPQAGYRWEEVKRKGVEILFAVDTSKSMLTPDAKPDRLTRAKMAIQDFVGHLDGDGVGLVAFAGNAFLQCPITLDYNAFNESLDAVDTNTIPRGGTDIASAIREAQASLQNRPGSDKILILLTDGEDLEGNAVDAAKAAAQTGLKIYTVGVGTSNGDLIPLPAESGGGFVKDDSGQYVKSHLDETMLKKIAEATGGAYAPLGAQGQGLETIYQNYIAPLTKHELASRQQKVYIERFQWPLAASLALLCASLMIGTRRNVKRTSQVPPVPHLSLPRRKAVVQGAGVAAAIMLASFSQAHASVSTAQTAYQKGDYTTAQKEYSAAAQKEPDKNVLQFNAGDAAYKAGQYPQAAEAFQKALGSQQSADPKELAAQQDAFYNLGNTLYRTGQKTEKDKVDDTIKTWEQAVKSYDSALQLKADDADAKFNRDFVQKKIDELKKQKQDQKNQDQKDQQNQKDQNQQGQSGQNSQDNKQDQSQSSNDKNQDQKDSKNQSGQGSNDKNVANNDKEQGQQKPQDPNGQGQQQDKSQANNQGKDQQNQQNPQNGSGQQKQDQTAQNKPDQGQGQQPDQQKQDQQQANNGSQGNQGQQPQNQQGQQPQGQQPQPGNGSQMAQNGANQNGNADQQRGAPGQMSPQEAKQLLDSLKDEQKNMPGTPIARNGDNSNQNDQPLKDW